MRHASWVSAAALLAAALAAPGAVERPRVETGDLYRARHLDLQTTTQELGQVRRGRSWDFRSKQGCLVTFLSPSARDPAFGPDGLRFTAAADDVLIGWGNYDNLQPPAERVPMFQGWNDVELTVSQTATGSVWRFQLWMDGNTTFDHNASRHEFGGLPWATVSKGAFEATATGTNRQTIRFRAFRGQPDGFSLRVIGPAENQVAIHALRITQERQGGVFRRTVALPPGRSIWRAVGEVSGGRLYINGREAEFMPDALKNRAALYPADLAPYLSPGSTNVLALDPAGGPGAYLQARVVLDDGSDVMLDTGPEWKEAPEPGDGWTTPAYDDAAWDSARHSRFDPGHMPARRWPAYDGRVLLENPGRDPKLFFDDTEPVRVAARIPGGWAGPRPDLRWVLRRVDAENQRPELGRGQVAAASASERAGSRVYELDVGRLDQGVYTLEVELAAGGAVLERRIEEPLIVVGRLPMQEVSGDAWDEGLELDLEDVIDFTDPEDPHAWTEAAAPGNLKKGPAGARVTVPRIVSTNGLTYREVTDGGAGALFAYRFEFKHPRDWYLMALEYPNDAERWTGVALVGATRTAFEQTIAPWRGSGDSWSVPSLVTGGKFPLDNALHELRWVCRAMPEVQSIELVNLRPALRAAAARLRVYRLKALPALVRAPDGGRLFGLHTERATHVGASFAGDEGMDEYQNIYKQMGYDLVGRFTQQLRWQAEGVRHYTAYLRFCGLNADVMSAFQYHEENTAYVPPDRVPGDGRIPQDIREVALRYFERNGIAMYSLVEYMEHKALRRIRASDDDVRRGADTLAFVSRTGKQGGWCVNVNHPAARRGLLQIADDLAEKFAFSPAWKGIFFNVTSEGEFAPAPYAPSAAPLEYDYSDATIARFEQDTGIRPPGAPGDPDRFALRHQFLTSDALRERWIEWRGRNMGSHLVAVRDALRACRPDLNVLCGWHITDRPLRTWLTQSGRRYGDFMRTLGMNPAAVRHEPGIWFGRTLYPVGASFFPNASYPWAHAVDPDAIAYYDMPNRLTVLNTCWWEYRTRPNDPDWPFGPKPNTLGLVAEGHDACSLEPFTQALIGSDPDILLYGFIDCPIPTGREEYRREVARVVTALPKEPFESVLGTADFRHNLAIRALRTPGAFWFYVANPGCWPIRGEVALSGRAAVARAHDGRPVETREADGRTVVPVALKPYGLAAFKVRAPDVSIAAWTNAPLAESDLAHMRGIVRAVRGLLAEPASALALPRADRDYMRAVCEMAEALIGAGRYAEAWSELTHWRFWELWQQVLIPARTESARLAGRPDPAADWAPGERPVLRVARAQGAPPVIDGRLDDAVWSRARPDFRFLGIGMGSSLCLGYPLMDMAVQAAYDDTALYVALRMADPDVSALKHTASPDQPIEVLRRYDDAAVIFLNAVGEQVRQFAVNAGGTTYCAASGGWGVGGDDLRTAAWRAAAAARPGEWVVEAAIPFSDLEAAAPESGDAWRANFLRRFRRFGAVPETWWAQIARWEQAERYGTLSFQ